MDDRIKLAALRRYLAWMTLVSAALFAFLLAIPTDPKNARFLGYSPLRLGMLGLALALLVAAGWAALCARRGSPWINRAVDIATPGLRRPAYYRLAMGLNVGLLAVGCAALLWSNEVVDPYLKAYIIRFAPFGFWLVAWCAGNVCILPVFHGNAGILGLARNDRTIRYTAVIFSAFVGLWIFAFVTGLGLRPDDSSWWGRGWGGPGVPLLNDQVLLAWGFCVAFLALGLFEKALFKRLSPAPRLGRAAWLFNRDLWIALAIWLAAAWLWSAQPLSPSWFLPAPRRPNLAYYPYSDAARHDVIAQNILIGEGFKWEAERVVRRPLYALYLAFLHLVAGQDYARLITWQVYTLAIFPLLVYLLGKYVHSRPAGVISAIFIIIRERSSIALSNVIDVSHAKLLMTDLPLALGIALFTLILVVWLRQPARKRYYPLLAGGVLGLLMLIRPQVALVAAVPALVGWFVRRGSPFSRLEPAFFVFLGLVVAVTPWLWRNWQLTGTLALDETSQLSTLARHYSNAPEDIGDARLPGETEAEYSQRMMGLVVQSIREDPLEVARFILSNFVRNEIDMALIFPTTLRLESIKDFVKRVPYWFRWDGSLAQGAAPYLILTLGVIALGMASAFRRQLAAGLLPLWISLAYSFSCAVARISGWRFILPADWAAILYFGIGLSLLTGLAGRLFTNGDLTAGFEAGSAGNALKGHMPALTSAGRVASPKLLFVCLAGIFLAGSSLPLVEWFSRPRYVDTPKSATLAYLQQAGKLQGLPGAAQVQLENALADPATVVMWGRALYPGYYPAGKGEAPSWPDFSPRDCDRLEFYLVGPQNDHVVLPVASAPSAFPDAADVLVVGYPADDHLEAAAVVDLGSVESAWFRSAIPPLTCAPVKTN